MKRYVPFSPGFTLAELLIVVSIIAILSIGGGIVGLQLLRRAQAARIVSDFRLIESAWSQWRADAGRPYPHEDVFKYAGNIDDAVAPIYCQDEGFMGGTALFRNDLSLPAPGAISSNWRGPYLEKEPLDPFGRHYLYDNDLDTYTSGDVNCIETPSQGHDNGGSVTNGANINIQACAPVGPRYQYLAEYIDKSIDNGDGACQGKFRWGFSGGIGGMMYLLDRQ